jgi:XTP/dITP diphosphohydrolase|tara:strand:+ start:29980 stop:30777 length:798 start_codon:yes stop_codon:yes gene_type:complete
MHDEKLNPKLKAFNRLLNIMDELREQCPWDKKQTLESLRKLTIEETYELADAILDKDLTEIKNEVGDLMLHMVFYAKIADEKGAWDIADALNSICEKLIFRHPHIYGDVKVENEEDVKRNWEKLKLKEGKKSVLEGVPSSLPAMVKATRIQEKVRGIGFDWDNKDQVWGKVQEELHELKEEIDGGLSPEETENEFGDLIFSLINFARFIDVDPESALERTNKKFRKRFMLMEEEIGKENKSLHDMNLAEMDVYWENAKQILKNKK